MLIDEVSLLGKRILLRVATLAQIREALVRVTKAHETNENLTQRGERPPKNRFDPMIRMHRSERHSSPNRIHAQVQHGLFLSKSSSEIARITHGCWLAVWSDLLRC